MARLTPERLSAGLGLSLCILSRWRRCCSGTRHFENPWCNSWFAAGGGRPLEAGLTGCTVLLRWFNLIFGVTQRGISHLTSYFHNYFKNIYDYQLTP